MGNSHPSAEGSAAGEERNPLSEAASRGSDEDVKRMLTKGKFDVNSRDSSQWTPLHRAAHNGHAFTCDLLISHGADIDAQTRWGSSPLHYASSNGHALCVRLLLSRGADRTIKNGAGNTASDEARDCNHRDVVQILERPPSSSSLFEVAGAAAAPDVRTPESGSVSPVSHKRVAA